MQCIWCGKVVFLEYPEVEQCIYCGVLFCKKHTAKQGEVGPTIDSCYKLILHSKPPELYTEKKKL